MVMKVVGMKYLVGFVGVNFVMVNVSINVPILTKLYLLWSVIELVGYQACGMACMG